MSIKFYDWDRGMKHIGNKTVEVTDTDGKLLLIKDVEFYDTLRGFIQTKDGLYAPQNLKDKLANNPS